VFYHLNNIVLYYIRLTPLITTYERKTQAKDYEAKVPEDIRINNAEKIASYRAELEETNKAIKLFESMKVAQPETSSTTAAASESS
jgi:hypothetical protein